MNEYLGVLSQEDPAFRFLSRKVIGEVLGFESNHHAFHAFDLHGQRTAIRYVDEITGVDVVLKYHGRKRLSGSRVGSSAERAERARGEFWKLIEARTLGLNSGPHLVPRPLAVSDEADYALAKEYILGEPAQDAVHRSLRQGGRTFLGLEPVVRAVAWFLKDLHSRSETDFLVDPARSLERLRTAIRSVSNSGIIGSAEQNALAERFGRWRTSDRLSGVQEVLCVGDANFSNFIQTPSGSTGHIDLEAACWGDRALDLGCIAAELKHLFLLHDLGWQSSEPFIRLFYEEYFYRGEAVRSETFDALTDRCRFFMALHELRMSRNGWLTDGHRRALALEAISCLA